MMLVERLKLLRCPENGSKLSLADPDLIRRLNQEISAGRLQNRAGLVVERPLDGGLVRDGGDVLYPIIDEIPVLLKDEAIAISVSS
jgi:uncharacterized protein YbaR (Trm112 family)